MAEAGRPGGGPEAFGDEVGLDKGAAGHVIGITVEEHVAAAGGIGGAGGGVAGGIPHAIEPRGDAVGHRGGRDDRSEFGLQEIPSGEET